jgi:hypothetical protein
MADDLDALTANTSALELLSDEPPPGQTRKTYFGPKSNRSDTLSPETALDAATKGLEENLAETARRQAAIKTARAVKHETPYDLAPRPRNPQELADILPGTQWVDPKGGIHTKPYAPTDPEDFKRVPEGAKWIDPEGGEHVRDVFDSLPFVAQTIFNMTQKPEEQEKALELFYPGQVKREKISNELYVDMGEGKRGLKPRGFAHAPISGIAAGLAPTAGAIAGEIMAGPPGVVAGSIIGQGWNDTFLKSLGVTERTVWDELESLGLAGLWGGVGAALGGTAARTAATGGQLSKMKPSTLAASALGVDAEGLDMAIAIKAKFEADLPPEMSWKDRTSTGDYLRERLFGKKMFVPVSMYAKEAPHLVNVTEVFDRAFHMNKPLLQSAMQYMEKRGRDILGKLGKDVSTIESLTEPTAAPSSRQAGETVLSAARQRVQLANTRLQELQQMQAAGKAGQKSRLAELTAAKKEAGDAADGFINSVYQDILKDIENGNALAKVGRNTGELWETIANKFKALKRAEMAEARRRYKEWTQEFGHIPHPNAAQAGDEARNFLSLLPEQFKKDYPGIVSQIERIGGVLDEKGNIIPESVQTFNLDQLHELRNIIRYGIDYTTFKSDRMNGQKMLFQDKIDKLLQDFPHAYRPLKEIDTWYQQTMNVFSEQRLQAVMNGLEGGEPADPRALYDVLIKANRTDLNKRFRAMLGENLWAGVRAADAEALMQESLSDTEGMFDANKFRNGVLERHRKGMLESIHGKETAQKWLDQARNLRLLKGKLDMPVKPGDKIPDVIQRVYEATKAIEDEAKRDPLGLLRSEMEQLQATRKLMKDEPLNFLYEPKQGAEEAIDKILAKPDLIYAAEQMFTRDSPAFNLIQQVAVERVLTGDLEPLGAISKWTKETQQLVFGVAYDDMKLLAKEMNGLMNTKAVQDTAKSMAAQSLVNHPASGFLGRGGTFLPKLPGFDVGARTVLGGYYGMWRHITSSRWFLEFLRDGVKSKDPAVREAVRKAFAAKVHRYMSITRPAGAGAGEGLYQWTQQDNPEYPGEAEPPIEKPAEEAVAQ